MSKDDKANIEAIKEHTKKDKITYLGYSQGTIQMHYALAHDDEGWYRENLHRVIHLAPCFVVEDLPKWYKMVYDSTIATFRENGIYSLNGPHWEETQQKIRDTYGEKIYEVIMEEYATS